MSLLDDVLFTWFDLLMNMYRLAFAQNIFFLLFILLGNA